MQKVVSILFFLSCFATSWLSSSMLGVGMWFWIIIFGGLFVGVSSFIPLLETLGTAVAGLLATISVAAVVLGLAASTIGDSSDFGDGTGLLLFLFALIAVFGFVLGSLRNRENKKKIDLDEDGGDLEL